MVTRCVALRIIHVVSHFLVGATQIVKLIYVRPNRFYARQHVMLRAP